MDVVSVLHMNGGMGEASYANNCLLQQKVICLTKQIRDEAITCIYKEKLPQSLAIADLGCSSGPNTLFMTCELIKTVETLCRKQTHESPEYIIYLNDLPSNDFNNIFKSLECFKQKFSKQVAGGIGQCYITGVPNSFYGRILPTSSLHFVHSSYSLHWMSQVPKGVENNKGNICMARTSPLNVREAYYHQFQKDFSMFLKCRAVELVKGGRAVLTFLGRSSSDLSSNESCYILELLAEALNDMVLEGIIKEDQMDSFNVPYYTPTPSEIKLEIEKEGSFTLNHLEAFEVSWKAACGDDELSDDNNSGYKVAQFVRAVAEPLFVSHFGEAIIDDVFHRYQDILADRMSKEKTVFLTLAISLTKTT
ncbi:S-adenosyl-L-methionine:benzoic acid/salicylic acid carboxyl methyltransferase 2-like [Prosopis cineraria]|uniref:S-adenosyl-L-methionine:benzoic acid/salicylic acid carboxyl methyltransferase 2-like n=1 Tax=Prosopis cineraria TaxID=364024 RepID=UPI00240F5AF1|nr:S-adenosyl-L-methionine:benzoic acid/salicylic acid carboxyl methyltransferase 2-like [Prosopis cineraria]